MTTRNLHRRPSPPSTRKSALIWIGIGGVLVRLVYVLRTSWNIRAYDWDGHLEYINYVLDHWHIPPANGAWQFYQPPLYYFLSAIVGLPIKLFGFSQEAIYFAIQIESFVLACAAFIAGLWIARMLFPSAKERTPRLLLAGLLAVFPGFVYFSSRITNDTLLLAFGFVFFALLYHWWITGKTRDWIGASLILSLGLLTKSNAMAWVPVLFGVLILRPKTRLRRKFSLGAIGLFMLLILTGWFFAQRFLLEKQQDLVGNIGSNNPGLRIQTIAPENFYTFRPVEILRYPFNSSWEDTYGRRYFWEHLFKSSVVGEWDFGDQYHDITRIIFAILMACVLSAFLGILRDLWSAPNDHAPLWILTVCLIFSMMALVIREPVGGFQDFRYIPLLIVPGFFYVLFSIRGLYKIIQQTIYQMLGILIVLCTLILLRLLSV